MSLTKRLWVDRAESLDATKRYLKRRSPTLWRFGVKLKPLGARVIVIAKDRLQIEPAVESPFIKLKLKNERQMKKHLSRADVELTSYPKLLQMEQSSACNLKCKMCATIRPNPKRTVAHLDQKVMNALRPVFPHVRDVRLEGGGEPFVNPNIDRNIEIYRSYGMGVQTMTNGVLITRERAKNICEAFSTLGISMNAATQETYEEIQASGKFEKLVSGLNYINEYRRPGLKLIFSFVLMRRNIHELPQLVALAKRFNVQQITTTWMVPFGDLPWTHDQDLTRGSDWERTNRFLDEARARSAEANISILTPNNLRPPKRVSKQAGSSAPVSDYIRHVIGVEGTCRYMYEHATVLVDGTVKPCCQASKPMGNLLENSFDEIWNGSKFTTLRETFNSGVLPDDCKRCSFLRSDRLEGAKLIRSA